MLKAAQASLVALCNISQHSSWCWSLLLGSAHGKSIESCMRESVDMIGPEPLSQKAAVGCINGTNRRWDCVPCKRCWLTLTLQVHGRLWPNLLPACHTAPELVPMHTAATLGVPHAGGSQHAAQHLQWEEPSMTGSWLDASRTKQQQLPTHVSSASCYDMFELLCAAQLLAWNTACL